MGFVHIEADCFDSNIYRMSESSQEKEFRIVISMVSSQKLLC